MRTWLAAAFVALAAVAARADDPQAVAPAAAPPPSAERPAPPDASPAPAGLAPAAPPPPDGAVAPAESAPPRPHPPAPPAARPAAPVDPEDVTIHVRSKPRATGAAAARAPGAAVTTIDAGRFAGEAKTTASLLATSPGVAVSEHGGPGQLAMVSIRGSSAEQVKILLDGLQLNGVAGGGVDLSTIPAAWISRIEVVRGTEGVHHGAGALGGVVNVVTLPVKPGTWGASATAGSFGTREGALHLAAGGDRWGLLGAVSGATTTGRFPYEDPYSHSRGERGHDASADGAALAKAFWLVGGGRLDAAAQLSGGRRELPGSIATPTPHDWQEEARSLVTARYRRPIGDGPVLSAGGWLRVERVAVRLADLARPDPTLQRGVAGGGSMGASWQGDRAAVSVSAEAGVDRLAASGMGEHTRVTTAAVLAGELRTLGGRVTIGPGVRLERAGRFQGISAKLGGEARIAGPLSVRLSAGRTYRVPSFAELYLQQGVVESNPALRPEVGLGADGALVLQGWAGSLSAGGFAVRYDDLVVYQTASFRRFVPSNLGRSAARGLELEGASAPARRVADLAVSGAYTLLDTETLRGPLATVGKAVPQKPRHRLHARVSGGVDPVELHAQAQWISERYLDLANTKTIPAAFTLDAGGAVRVHRAPDVHLNLEVRNALDVRTAEDGFMNPLPGRAIFVTVRAGAAP